MDGWLHIDWTWMMTAQERKDFARLLGKIEQSLDLVQTSAEADAKAAY